MTDHTGRHEVHELLDHINAVLYPRDYCFTSEEITAIAGHVNAVRDVLAGDPIGTESARSRALSAQLVAYFERTAVPLPWDGRLPDPPPAA